jgi:hypothetical protein
MSNSSFRTGIAMDDFDKAMYGWMITTTAIFLMLIIVEG